MSEINPAAEALVEDIGRRLVRGAALIIDYGFPAAEYYHPQRHQGTLMCHYRHRAHADPFLWPGLTDITAHVDFTAIARAGERGGTCRRRIRRAGAISAWLRDPRRACRERRARVEGLLQAAAPVQRLLSPAEMGELFKVIALAKSDGIAWPGFALADRSHRL